MQFHVEGMDCASCVRKIETALTRMPGVAEVRLNFASEKLDVSLSPDSPTQASDVEKIVKDLGFGIRAVAREMMADGAAPQGIIEPRGQRWWQTRKGRHVAGLGLLMGAAWICALLAPAYGATIFTLAVIAGVIPFARKAWTLAASGTPFSIEMLMSVAALGGLFIGEAEEAAAVVFLFAVGELLESVAADRARAGIKTLASLVPKTALLLDAGGAQREVPVSSLQPEDQVLVRPGDRVPADGVIVHGASSLDESPITGESVPRARETGEQVYAGSINVDGVLRVSVTRTAADNTIARIIHLVEEAQASKAPTARFIEEFSRWYTPVVMGIAALIVLVPPLFMGADWETWLYRGLALLLIACPCALVLSTPAAIASGLAAGTRRGLLVKGGHALETIGRVGAVAFDKTGTLTEGAPRVTDVVAFTDEDSRADPGGGGNAVAVSAAGCIDTVDVVGPVSAVGIVDRSVAVGAIEGRVGVSDVADTGSECCGGCHHDHAHSGERASVNSVWPLATAIESESHHADDSHDAGINTVLSLAAAIESGSSHPLAQAIVRHAEERGIAIPPSSDARATAGKAVHATVDGRKLAVGSPVYAALAAHLTPEQQAGIETLQKEGKTVSVLIDEQNHAAIGLLAMRDEPRQDARDGIAALTAMGVRAIMLTGDNQRTAQAIAGKLGIEYEAELLPQDKLRRINELKGAVRIAMVGDGINDAPALATADVGIAMGGGTDVAIETADAALMKSRVTDVAHLVALSRATMANIRQNVVFALGLKGVFLITTILGFTGLWVAVLADTGATALVTLNALRLLRFRGLRA